MSGYKQLLDLYSENHLALAEAKGAIRDSVNGVRIALAGLLGLASDTEIVSIDTKEGIGLFSALAKLEHRQSLDVELALALTGANDAPDTSIITEIRFNVIDRKVNVFLPSMKHLQVINTNEDYHQIAQVIFNRALQRLSDF